MSWSPAFLQVWRKRSSYTPRSSCGIAIRDGQLVAVQLTHEAGQRPVLLGHAVLPAPAGLNTALLQQLSQTMDLSGAVLRYVLTANQCRLQLTELPAIPAEEFKQALSWRLAELFADHQDQQEPNSSNFTFDVLPLPSAQSGKPPSQALAFGLSNQVLQPLQMAFHDAALALSVVDVADLAQRNLSALAEPDGRGLAVLSFNEQGGLLTVTQGGELYMARHLETSLVQLTRADEDSRNLLLERVALDVQRSFDVFDRQYQALGLSRLLIAPMPSMPSMLQTLSQNLFVPVDWFDLAALVDLPAAVQPWMLWPALGAALRPLEVAV